MDQMDSCDAILFPSDDRAPHLVPLMMSVQPGYANTPSQPYQSSSQSQSQSSKVPHPEMYMNYIAEGIGSRAWQYHPVEALEGMNKTFSHPYVIFYPVVSRDGMPFPINKCIREIQGPFFKEDHAWRGNIVVAKYRDERFSTMMDATMADFPLLKNFLSTNRSPLKNGSSSS